MRVKNITPFKLTPKAAPKRRRRKSSAKRKSTARPRYKTGPKKGQFKPKR